MRKCRGINFAKFAHLVYGDSRDELSRVRQSDSVSDLDTACEGLPRFVWGLPPTTTLTHTTNLVYHTTKKHRMVSMIASFHLKNICCVTSDYVSHESINNADRDEKQMRKSGCSPSAGCQPSREYPQQWNWRTKVVPVPDDCPTRKRNNFITKEILNTPFVYFGDSLIKVGRRWLSSQECSVTLMMVLLRGSYDYCIWLNCYIVIYCMFTQTMLKILKCSPVKSRQKSTRQCTQWPDDIPFLEAGKVDEVDLEPIETSGTESFPLSKDKNAPSKIASCRKN